MVRVNPYNDDGAKEASLLTQETSWGASTIPNPEDVRQYNPASSSLKSILLPLDVPQLLREYCNINSKEHVLIYMNEKNNVQVNLSRSLSAEKKSSSRQASLEAIIKAVRQIDENLTITLKDAKANGKDRLNHFHDKQPVRVSDRVSTEKSYVPLDITSSSSALPNADAKDPSTKGTLDGESDRDNAVEEPDDDFTDIKNVDKQFEIGDKYSVDNYYDTRFRQMQQLACKVVAKAWVKVVESKKQVKHPYNGGKIAKEQGAKKGTGGELTKPDWWPKYNCRHREPDHLKKDERILLLKHILALANRQPTKDSEQVTVDKLKSSTYEVASSWAPEVRKWLEEVYWVRKHEVRYQNCEIDDTSPIRVIMPDAKIKRRPARRPRSEHSKKREALKVKSQGRNQKGRSTAKLVTTSTRDFEPIKSTIPMPSDNVSPLINVSADKIQYYKQELLPEVPDDLRNFQLLQSTYMAMDAEYPSQYQPFLYSTPNNSTLPLVTSYASPDGSLQPGLYQSFNAPQACEVSSSSMDTITPFHDTSWGSQAVMSTPQAERGWPAGPTILDVQTPTVPMTFQLPLRLAPNSSSSSSSSGIGFSNGRSQYPPELADSTARNPVPNPFCSDYSASVGSRALRHPNQSLMGAFDFSGSHYRL